MIADVGGGFAEASGLGWCVLFVQMEGWWGKRDELRNVGSDWKGLKYGIEGKGV